MRGWIGGLIGLGLVALGLPASGCGGKTDEPAELRLKLRAGDRFHLRRTLEQEMTHRPRGVETKLKQKFGAEYAVEVRSAGADGTAELAVQYYRLTYELDGPDGRIEFDSSAPPDVIPPPARMFAATAGHSLTALLGPDGTVREVRGGDELFAMLSATLDLAEGAARDRARESWRQQVGEAALTEDLELALRVLPPRAVRPGQTWTTQVVLSTIQATATRQFTLKSLEGGVATIDFTARLAPIPNAPASETEGMRMTTEVSGTQQGTCRVDSSSGLLRSATWTQEVKGKVSSMLAGRTSVWPMTGTGTVSVVCEVRP